jgi:hypothetical protein
MGIINNNGTRPDQKAAVVTITTATTAYSHEVGKDLIPELAMRVYSSPLDSFREAISNAFDENSVKVVLLLLKDKIVIEVGAMASEIMMNLGNLGMHQKNQEKEKKR